LFSCQAALCCVIAWVFWWQDLRYALPTPRPAGLEQPPTGATFADLVSDERPTLLHFFNPDCPCSRFNLTHLRRLTRDFAGRVRFVAVLSLETDANPSATLKSFSAWHLDAEPLLDPGGRLAARLGVFATPQAVVLGRDGRLIFRGNYNAGRYCVDPRTEFARLALLAAVEGTPLPEFPPVATTAYGCELPTARSPE
jgi:hypothetical protein